MGCHCSHVHVVSQVNASRCQFYRLVFATSLIAVSPLALAHSGGLNADGCHTNRKTGDYHCHRSPAKAAGSPDAYAQALADNRRTTSSRADRTGMFANCAEARAAGAAPVHRGEPGFGAHLDRDGDGIGCESSRRRR